MEPRKYCYLGLLVQQESQPYMSHDTIIIVIGGNYMEDISKLRQYSSIFMRKRKKLEEKILSTLSYFAPDGCYA